MLIRCTSKQSHGGVEASIEMFEDDSNALMDNGMKIDYLCE